MTKLEETEFVYLNFLDLVDRVYAVFTNNGCSERVARLLATNCVSAERDGAHSHGLFRLTGYVNSLKSGWVDGAATPVVEDVAPAFVRIDGRNGFTVASLASAKELAIRKARANGVSVIAIRNSHHLGALSLDVEPFAEEALFAFSVINSMKAVVPFAGRSAAFGTNPIAFAAPRAGDNPLVVDLATSTVAHGDVQIAARDGRQLEPGAGVDRAGNPTTDPHAVLDGGALLPFGGHKGSAIAMLVEIMCAAIVGGRFSHEVDLSTHPGAATPNTGQLLILIDPETGRGGISPFANRMETLVEAIREAGQKRLPGDRRCAARTRAARFGIPVMPSVMRLIDELAGNLDFLRPDVPIGSIAYDDSLGDR